MATCCDIKRLWVVLKLPNKSRYEEPKYFFKATCCDSTLLVVTFPKCITAFVQAQTNRSLYFENQVSLIYLRRSLRSLYCPLNF